MDGELGGEAVAHRLLALGAKAVQIAEAREDRVDRRNIGGDRAEKAEIAREPERLGELAIRAVGGGADIRGEIFPPHAIPARRLLTP